jgi:hypothetical protein
MCRNRSQRFSLFDSVTSAAKFHDKGVETVAEIKENGWALEVLSSLLICTVLGLICVVSGR